MSAIALHAVSTLSAPFFIRPRDALANSLVSAPMLFTVDLTRVPGVRHELELFRWLAFGAAVITGVLAASSIALQNVPRANASMLGRVSRLSYRLAVPLGDGAVMFTPLALISIIGFYQQRPVSMLWLVSVWLLMVVAKPVQLLLEAWDIWWQVGRDTVVPKLVGLITRVDDPNIVRVSLDSPATWNSTTLHAARLPGDRHVDVVPLFIQTQDDLLIGTGLCSEAARRPTIASGQVWTEPSGAGTEGVIRRLAGQTAPVDLIGFVIEESRIAEIRFEVADGTRLSEGAVVFVRDGDATVYFQVLDVVTKEEVFTQNPRGTHVVIAGQLGTIDHGGSFRKHGRVPSMNAPVFLSTALLHAESTRLVTKDEFVLGTVAQTGLPLKASLLDMLRFHTAVLGVTGTGKTELVFDLIRAHLAAGRKVFCVDFTGEYKPRLSDLTPTELGFDQAALDDLDANVNATEHGKFNAADEKKALADWVAANRPKVEEQIRNFMNKTSDGVGVFELPDIANTRATLRATEMYLSAVFAWARKNRRLREIVVVLEEAHTIVPETNLYRYDKADTDAVVGRMAQIALQGRKYGVGLLLVSQRTALVSKTLLSQCNTCICFAMYDKTGLDYLESVFASTHAKAIPNLRFLQGIAFGKAVKSDRPVIFEIPEDSKKRDASDALNASMPVIEVHGETAVPPEPEPGTPPETD